MTGLLIALAVGAAGGLGSALRYVVDHSLSERTQRRFPWGIMLVNLTGSFLLGVLAGVVVHSAWGLVVTTGLLGGYTTFSTASLDSVRLLQDKKYVAALLNGPGMLAACAALAALGIWLGA